MAEVGTEKYIKVHAIQLHKVNVAELFIKPNTEPDPSIETPCDSVPLIVGYTDYDTESSIIFVSLKTEIGERDDSGKTSDFPYALTVEVVGEFHVDESQFPVEQLRDWALRNAPMILQPYLREHVYSLTLRGGFQPLILPLIQVPTLKSAPAKEKKEPETTS